MFDIGGGELIVIIIAIIVLFGPKKIPELSRTLGKGMKKVKEAQSELKEQLNNISKD